MSKHAWLTAFSLLCCLLFVAPATADPAPIPAAGTDLTAVTDQLKQITAALTEIQTALKTGGGAAATKPDTSQPSTPLILYAIYGCPPVQCCGCYAAGPVMVARPVDPTGLAEVLKQLKVTPVTPPAPAAAPVSYTFEAAGEDKKPVGAKVLKDAIDTLNTAYQLKVSSAILGIPEKVLVSGPQADIDKISALLTNTYKQAKYTLTVTKIDSTSLK